MSQITDKIITLDESTLMQDHIDLKWIMRGKLGGRQMQPHWFKTTPGKCKVIIFVENDTLPANINSQELYPNMDIEWYKFDITSSLEFYNFTRFRSDSLLLNSTSYGDDASNPLHKIQFKPELGYSQDPQDHGCGGCYGGGGWHGVNGDSGVTNLELVPLPFFFFIRGDGYKNIHQGSASLSNNELESKLQEIDPETWDDWEIDPWGKKPWQQLDPVRPGSVPKKEDAVLKTMSGYGQTIKYKRFGTKAKIQHHALLWKAEKQRRAKQNITT